jgi:hypothetical protein
VSERDRAPRPPLEQRQHGGRVGEVGLDVVEQVPLIVGIGPNNHQYLETKRDRMGHIIGQDEIADALERLGGER